jgi:hypothetical protein
MRRARILLVVLIVALSASSAAAATPPGKGLESFPATCNGQATTITASSGAAFWVADQKYVLQSITFVFTPTGGDPQTFTKTYGKRKGLTGPPIHCTGSFSDPEGTATFDATGVPTP